MLNYQNVKATGTILLNAPKARNIYFGCKIAKFNHRKVFEVGSYLGGTSLLCALSLGSKYKNNLVMCDPFEGHPSESLSEFDSRFHPAGHFGDTSLEIVNNLFEKFELRPPKIIQSPIEKAGIEISEISRTGLLHIDTDLYKPTLFTLELFGKHMPVGGLIFLDDVGARKCPGVEIALKEFLVKFRKFFCVVYPTKEQVLLIKWRKIKSY